MTSKSSLRDGGTPGDDSDTRLGQKSSIYKRRVRISGRTETLEDMTDGNIRAYWCGGLDPKHMPLIMSQNIEMFIRLDRWVHYNYDYTSTQEQITNMHPTIELRFDIRYSVLNKSCM